MQRKLSAVFEKSQRLSNLISYLILSVLMVCVSITYIHLLQSMMRETDHFQVDYLPVLVGLVVLESIFSRSAARELEGRERILYHIAEWISIAVCLKVFFYIYHGFDQLALDLPRWQEDILTFFEGDYSFSFLFLIFAWVIARFSANDIENLNTDAYDANWEIGQLQNTRLRVRSALTSRILWVGILMVVLATITRMIKSATPGAEAVQDSAGNILVYFILALVLFTQAQFSFLRARWFWQKTDIDPALARRWILTSLAFFAFLGFISFLLPTNYAMGLLETLNFVFNGFISILFLLMQLIFLPLLWLLSIAGCSNQAKLQPSETPAPALPLFTALPPVPIPWLQILQSILFWVVFIGILGYSLVQFVHQNPQMWALLNRIKIFTWLVSFLTWIRKWMGGAGKQISLLMNEARQRFLSNRGPTGSAPGHIWQNFRQLNPRQQIILYYLQLVAHGDEHGLKRQAHQTPYEYAETLGNNLPDVQEDIASITDTFLEARYSKHEIAAEQPSQVQKFWRNIIRSLGHFKK